ncbi:MAG: ATP synthase subunit C [Candidatus Asgardarchaeia archaeon]
MRKMGNKRKLIIFLVIFIIVPLLAIFFSFFTYERIISELGIGYMQLEGDRGLIALSAAIAIGLTGIGASYGMAISISSTIAAMSERPEIFARALAFIVLIEAIAIYGFVIAFLLIGKI